MFNVDLEKFNTGLVEKMSHRKEHNPMNILSDLQQANLNENGENQKAFMAKIAGCAEGW